MHHGCKDWNTYPFRLFSSLPPTAFTPEPVRRRLAGMKRILLMIAVVVVGCG